MGMVFPKIKAAAATTEQTELWSDVYILYSIFINLLELTIIFALINT